MTQPVIVETDLKYAEGLCSALASVAAEKIYLASAEPFTLKQTQDFISYCVRCRYPQFILLDGTEVVGWCDVVASSALGYGKLGIGIIAPYRGQGYGSALMEKTISACRGKFREIELYVRESNLRAIGLYEKFGFNRRFKLTSEYRNLGEKAVYMRLKL